MNWTSIADELPAPDVDVLVYRPSQYEPRIEIKHLKIDGSGYKAWYPGGSGIAWMSHWMALPKPPAGPIKVFVGTETPSGFMDVYPK